MASHPYSHHQPVETESGAFFKVAAVLLGLRCRSRGLLRAPDVGGCARRGWSRGERNGEPCAPGRRPQHSSAPGELRRCRPGERARVGRCAQGLRRDAASSSGRRPDQGADDAEGHDSRDRSGRQVQHLGLRRPRCPRPDRPCPRRADGRDDADERRRDPALDRFPRRSDCAEHRVQGRLAGQVDQLPLRRRRPRCLHVPLRHEAGARAHRERDVWRDRGPAEARHCRRSTTSTCLSAASGT